MCLILFAYQTNHNTPLVVAANRDERFDRASRPAQFWPDSPHLLAGCDLEAGGTWLGITRSGRFAAVTNFRGHHTAAGEFSRGELTTAFLQSDSSSKDFVEQTLAKASRYAGFNLLCFDGADFIYCNNNSNDIRRLTSGIYGLSNGTLDSEWPKVSLGKQHLEQVIASHDFDSEQLLSILRDDKLAADHQLPNTGISLDRERQLSPRFIRATHHGYGTCNSTAMIVKNDAVFFHERSFYEKPLQENPTNQQIQFRLQTEK